MTEAAATLIEMIPLALRDWDTLVIRHQGPPPAPEDVQNMRDTLAGRGMANVFVLVVSAGLSLERLDTEGMFMHGWRRVQVGRA